MPLRLNPAKMLSLAVLGLAIGLAGCASTHQRAPDQVPGKATARVPDRTLDAALRRIAVSPAIAAAVNRVNRHRRRYGLGRVTLHARLNRAALRHAEAMAARDFFSHDGADGSTVGLRVTQSGYIWGLVAENIAAGQRNPSEAIRTWMDSPGHRHNILMKGVVHIGLAHVRRDPDPGSVSFKDYWVMVLAAPIR